MTRAGLILLRSVLFLAFLVAFDRCLGGVLSAILHTTDVGKRTDLLAPVKEAQPEFLIVGNSRARCHYNPKFFESIMRMRTYNAGCEGQLMPYTRAMIDLALQECRPRICLIDVDAEALLHDATGYSGITVLAAHLDRSAVAEQLLSEAGPLKRMRFASTTARFNRVVPDLIANTVSPAKTAAGFFPLFQKASLERLDLAVVPHGAEVLSASPRMMAMLEECVRTLEASGVWVALASSPYWRKGFQPDPRYRTVLEEVASLAQRLGVPFIETNQQNAPAFRNPALFADDYHLNGQGANHYSGMVAEHVRRIYWERDIKTALSIQQLGAER